MKAQKLPSGSYRARVMVNGTAKSFTAETAREAVRLANEWKYLRNAPRKDMTVAAAIDAYIASISDIRSPSTIAGYRKIKNNQFQCLMQIRLSRLTQADVNVAVNAEKKKGLSAKTIANAHGLLAAVLRVYYPELILNTRLPQQKKRPKVLQSSPSEIYAAVKGSAIELPVLLAMCLSLSMSEIRGLKKTDIQSGILHVQRSKVYVDRRQVVKDELKEENRDRYLAVPDFITELIDKVETDYITELSGSAINKRYTTLLRKAGLPHMTFHDLRHVNASVMHLLGVPDKYAMERGGWKTDHTMKSVYQNTFSAERQKFDAIIDSFFENVVSNSCQNSSQ